MNGMHGILKPMGQDSPETSTSPPKAPPEVYHKLPGQFYQPSNSEGNTQRQPEQRAHDHQQQPQQPQQQQNHRQNAPTHGSAPPIDPSLFSMYPEPSASNGGSFSAPNQPYHMPDHSSTERPPLFALPSLEQIATEVLDMNGGADENGEAGLAAIQAFNRQRDGYIQAYQQQNGGLLPMDAPPPVDDSVDSGVSLSGLTEHKDGSSPPGGVFNAHANINGLENASDGIKQESAKSPAIHHEPSSGETETQAQPKAPAKEEAQADMPENGDAAPFSEFQLPENEERRSSVTHVPFYQPPVSMSQSPEMMRSMPHGLPPSSPDKFDREPFMPTSPEMFRRPSQDPHQGLE